MPHNKVTTACIQELRNALKPEFVLLEKEDKRAYESDETLSLHVPCSAVVKPQTAEEIAEIVKICNRHKVPLIPRGGGTGVAGGALPIHEGIVLSLERLNKIIEINELDRTVTAEAGVVTQTLQEALLTKALSFPVIPGSWGSSCIGGNVATSAGSPKSAKYGTIKDYVLNLEVVLSTGEIIWTGASVNKDVAGFDLTALFTGSEGTLGIITKIVLKAIPAAKAEVVLLAPFTDKAKAFEAMKAILLAGITPASLEIIYGKTLGVTSQYLDENLPLIAEHIGAHLLINYDSNSQEEVFALCERTSDLLEKWTCDEILMGVSHEEKQKLWKLRESIGPAMTHQGKTYRDVDACVPRSKILEFMQGVDTIGDKYGLKTLGFGHVMDGNLHTMILYDADEKNKTGELHQDEEGIAEIYQLAIDLGGAITGEHGIGILQKPYLSKFTSVPKMQLMQAIKKAFDPNNILNPGKIFD